MNQGGLSMTKSKKPIDLAKRLISVNIEIYKIYDALAESYDNKDLHKKNLEYLKVALDIENNIYKEIGDNLLTSQEFEHALKLAFESLDIADYIYDEVYFRIYNYIESKISYYPFCEDRYSTTDNLEINTATIERHIIYDIDLLSYYNLLQIMKNANYNYLLPYLNQAKYTVLFRCKYFDNLAFNDLKSAKPTARERLLTFNHDKNLVALKFREILFEGLQDYSANAFDYESSSKTTENYADVIINLVQVKTYLELTSKEEAFEIFLTYFKTLEENAKLKKVLEKSVVNDKIRDLIKVNFINKSDNKVLSKS